MAYHKVELITDMVSGVATLIQSLHLERIWRPCLDEFTNERKLLHDFVILQAYLFNQIAISLLARDRRMAVESPLKYDYTQKPYRKIFGIYWKVRNRAMHCTYREIRIIDVANRVRKGPVWADIWSEVLGS